MVLEASVSVIEQQEARSPCKQLYCPLDRWHETYAACVITLYMMDLSSLGICCHLCQGKTGTMQEER